ncbi:hypothetical protein ABW19_dt0206611 [Dactylella cylindrospora]|nr:hypothetical protein ABW19_dt0206611 [Dactylella cylindrospora]
MRYTTLAGLASFVTAASAALTPVTIRGNAFFVGNDRFYIRGVDYQPDGASDPKDPLADTAICGRDIPAMQELGLNAIRVYTVDSAANHDECMQMLEDAGIYLILDVNTPFHSISRDNPALSYNEVYLQHVFGTMDVFSQYPHTMAYFAGNEVVNNETNTAAATYVKATVRDMKAYQTARRLRAVPIGYSAADVAQNRQLIAEYMNSGPDAERVDFHAFNDYSWCGSASSFQISGYDQKVRNYTGYGIPTFLSEFGCNIVTPRTFDEVESIYHENMTVVFSGGLVYEWTNETNNYGLVQVSEDRSSIDLLVDYENLKSMYESVPNPTGNGGATLTDGEPSECPPQVPGVWEADCTLPAMPEKAEVYLEDGAGEPLGLDGPTNQWSDDSTDEPSGTQTSTPSSTASETPNAAVMAVPSFNIVAITSVGSIILAGLMGGAALL